jgi:hypothetical protein
MKGNKMKKSEMLATIATLAAALDYVVSVDENQNKITPELQNSLSGIVQETKETFALNGEEDNFTVYEEKQMELFERFSSEGVDDLTGTYF